MQENVSKLNKRKILYDEKHHAALHFCEHACTTLQTNC